MVVYEACEGAGGREAGTQLGRLECGSWELLLCHCHVVEGVKETCCKHSLADR